MQRCRFRRTHPRHFGRNKWVIEKEELSSRIEKLERKGGERRKKRKDVRKENGGNKHDGGEKDGEIEKKLKRKEREERRERT